MATAAAAAAAGASSSSRIVRLIALESAERFVGRASRTMGSSSSWRMPQHCSWTAGELVITAFTPSLCICRLLLAQNKELLVSWWNDGSIHPEIRSFKPCFDLYLVCNTLCFVCRLVLAQNKKELLVSWWNDGKPLSLTSFISNT
jgi:hypothetical protein